MHRPVPCCFCEKLLSGTSEAPWDFVIRDTGDHVIVPSRGSLVPGWLLVVPKAHSLCVGALQGSELEQLNRAIGIAKALVEKSFGSATVFEHGPARAGTAVGCGIDHLHVHVVPLGFSLAAAVESLIPGIVWSRISSPKDLGTLHKRHVSYGLLREPGGPLLWCEVPSGARQMMRRAIARELGKDAEFDYASYPRVEIAEQTLSRLLHVP